MTAEDGSYQSIMHPNPGAAEKELRTGSRDKTVLWYKADPANMDPHVRKLLVEYSGIPEGKVVEHVKKVRDEAWEVWPFPCLGGFRFLEAGILANDAYPDVLRRVKDGQSFLDVGCCLGQDIRKLVYDGAPSDKTYGSDLRSDFWRIGYDLFLDKNKLKTKFIAADIFDAESELKSLNGTIDIINAGSFMHLFDWQKQVDVARQMVQILRPQRDSLVLGSQMANLKADEYEKQRHPGEDVTRFRHNADSFKKLWEQVGEEVGVKFRVDAKLIDPGLNTEWDWVDKDLRRMLFAVWREGELTGDTPR